MNEPSSPRLRSAIFWLCFAALCFTLSLRVVNDPDIWFQLLAGRFAIDHMAVPHHDFFVYAGTTAKQLFGGWGFGVLAELATRAAGWGGLSIFNAFLWTLTLCAGMAAARARSGKVAWEPFVASEVAACSITLLVVYQAFLGRSDLRAEVTLYLAWMLGAWLFESFQAPPRIKRALLLFPLLCYALAWLHTTSILMLALFASHAVRRWRNRVHDPVSRHEMAWWLGSLVAAVVLPTLTPNGIFQAYAQPLYWLLGTGGETGISDATLTTAEYLPLWDSQSREFWPIALGLGGGTLAWAALDLRRRPYDLVALLPMIVMAMTHRRGLGLWAMALVVPLATALARGLRELGDRQGNPRVAAASQFGAAAAAALMTGLLVGQSGKWGWGLPDNAGIRPQEAARIVSKLMPEGGNAWMFDQIAPQVPYLLGERYKVAYAGHMIFPNRASSDHYVRVMAALPGWDAELDKYHTQVVGVPSVILPMPELVRAAKALSTHPNWRLVAIDRQILFFQRLPAGQAASAAQRWQQLHDYLENAIKMAETSNALQPQPRAAALVAGLRKAAATLETVRDRPQDFDWKKLDTSAGYEK